MLCYAEEAEAAWPHAELRKRSTYCSSVGAAGKPLYGTLIALLRDGEPVLGVIDQPILKERWLGVAGQQTTLNGNNPQR